MKYPAYPVLTWSILETYGGRKQAGFISVFVNMKTNEVIPIPIGQEHIEVASDILGATKEDILFNPSICAHLIPGIIQLTNKKIVAVVTGASGMEIGYNVRHYVTDVQKAHTIIWSFITSGEIPVGQLLENRIIRKYTIKA